MNETCRALLRQVLAVLDGPAEFQCGPKGKHLAPREQIRAAVTEPERTPEVVLRAMVHAYADAAVAAEADVFSCPGKPSNALMLRMFDTQNEAANMRAAAAATFFATGEILPYLRERTDYEKRLRGDLPLNAPPLEV